MEDRWCFLYEEMHETAGGPHDAGLISKRRMR